VYIYRHVNLQEDAAYCFVTDVEFRRTHEGKIQAVGAQKQSAGKKVIFVLHAREKQERMKLSKKGLDDQYLS